MLAAGTAVFYAADTKLPAPAVSTPSVNNDPRVITGIAASQSRPPRVPNEDTGPFTIYLTVM